MAPVVSTSSIRRTLRGSLGNRLDLRRMGDPLGTPSADLVAGSRGGPGRRRARTRAARRVPPPAHRRDRSPGDAASRARPGPDTTAPPSRCFGHQPVHTLGHQPPPPAATARNFKAPTSARATPSCGAEDQTRSTPCGPPVINGRAAPRVREHRVQSTASARHPRPHAAQSGGARQRRGDATRSIPGPKRGNAHAWCAESQIFVSLESSRERRESRR